MFPSQVRPHRAHCERTPRVTRARAEICRAEGRVCCRRAGARGARTCALRARRAPAAGVVRRVDVAATGPGGPRGSRSGLPPAGGGPQGCSDRTQSERRAVCGAVADLVEGLSEEAGARARVINAFRGSPVRWQTPQCVCVRACARGGRLSRGALRLQRCRLRGAPRRLRAHFAALDSLEHRFQVPRRSAPLRLRRPESLACASAASVCDVRARARVASPSVFSRSCCCSVKAGKKITGLHNPFAPTTGAYPQQDHTISCRIGTAP